MPDAVTDLPPELADHPKFRIVRELGRGGMGVIYLAEHRVMDKPVALKVISPAVLDNPTAVGRFLAEVRAAGKLDHQNIARAYDADRAGDLHFLVMEYIEGVSLAQLLEQQGPLPIPSACHYIRQAALGLHHAFEQGMVHRDVKPQNLMLTPKGVVKVLDFGLARLRGERHESTRLTQMESFMGTPEYVAPEQATDARKADTRSDIYSLGCTLYALLAGRPPFVGDTVVQVVLAHVEHQPRPLHERRPDVPRELSAVVAKMLAKDPAKRYQRPIDAAQALVPFVQPGGQSEASAVPLAIPVTALTLVDGDTRPEKRRRNERAKPSARKDRDKSTDVPVAWWARPVVIVGAAAAVLALAAVAGAGVLVLLLLMADKDPRIAVAPPPGPEHVIRRDEPDNDPAEPAAPAPDAEPAGGGSGGAAAVPPEHESASNDPGKATPAVPEKTAEEKKADEDAAQEARRREQARKAADEAAKRELAEKKAEEDRRRKQAEKAAEEVRKREEARQKAETTAATRLKLAKKLPDAARDAYDHGNLAEEKRLKQQYTEALHDIVKKYPNTKAAKEAQELLDK